MKLWKSKSTETREGARQADTVAETTREGQRERQKAGRPTCKTGDPRHDWLTAAETEDLDHEERPPLRPPFGGPMIMSNG